MGDWNVLLPRLSGAEHSLTLTWSELEDLVGELPSSATRHRSWWSGNRPHTRVWRSAGFEVSDLRPGIAVTFERRALVDQPSSSDGPAPSRAASIVLVSCVKEKLERPAAARDFYTSALFRKERAYAEASGAPWFILSAEHGLVAPDDWLAPYDRYLPDTPVAYRRALGEWVAARLSMLVGPLIDVTVEIHAGATYVEAVRGPLEQRGASVLTPLDGLSMGQRLSWYGGTGLPEVHVTTGAAHDAVDAFVRELSLRSSARSVDAFLAADRSALNAPGLYSWWVDVRGAADLADGVGSPVAPDLIYAGLAGATRWPSGKQSTNTLWSRIAGMHLGKRHEFSTFRRTLGSVLAAHRHEDHIDEQALTSWMREHLEVIAIPFDDPDTLGRLERDVLTALDPPLNLQGMAATPVRRKLTELRRQHARK